MKIKLNVILGMPGPETEVTLNCMQALGQNPVHLMEPISSMVLETLNYHPLTLRTPPRAAFETKKLNNLINSAQKKLKALDNGKNQVATICDHHFSKVIPFWQTVFQDLEIIPTYMVVIRDPQSSSMDFLKRVEVPVEFAGWLWLSTMIPAFLETMNTKPLFTNFLHTFKSPQIELARWAKHLKIEPPLKSEIEKLEKNLLDPLRPILMASEEDLAMCPYISPFSRKIYSFLDELSNDITSHSSKRFDEIQNDFKFADQLLWATEPLAKALDQKVLGK